MKKLILKLILFFCLAIVIISITLLKYGGYVDYFYEKFTTPKTASMIIGDSRGLQGIQPHIIDSLLIDSKFNLPILNYSFTIAQSHIGPLYNKSILKKIDNSTKNGLFIISINPWMLGSKKVNNNYKGEFKERGNPPHNMTNVTMSPNFEYFIKNLNYFHFKAVFRRKLKLHKNGWLEVDNLPKDLATFNNWRDIQLKTFNGFLKNYNVSEYRKKSLDTLVKTLKSKGEVYLVRTPINKGMLDLENTFFKDFDDFIEKLSIENKIHYLNYNKTNRNQTYKTYDGHHIDKNGGILFTKSLCDSIKKYNH